jgi:hypothetical protein
MRLGPGAPSGPGFLPGGETAPDCLMRRLGLPGVGIVNEIVLKITNLT